MTGDKEKYLATGADNYIAKPIDLDELISAISMLNKN